MIILNSDETQLHFIILVLLFVSSSIVLYFSLITFSSRLLRNYLTLNHFGTIIQTVVKLAWFYFLDFLWFYCLNPSEIYSQIKKKIPVRKYISHRAKNFTNKSSAFQECQMYKNRTYNKRTGLSAIHRNEKSQLLDNFCVHNFLQ